MSENQNNNNLPDLTGVKGRIENTLNLADWLLDLWQSSKWSKRMILLTGLTGAAIEFAEYYLKKEIISDANEPVFYATIDGSIILAVIIAYFERKQPLPPRPDIPERNAIKGLRAFEFNDAEVFKRLQRNAELSSCLTVITTADFKFGVLYAESGCGKTSFLQAGLYHLINNHPEHSCVYVKFSNEEPETLVLEALKKRANQPGEAVLDLVGTILSQQNKASLVLVLDQFEQFFLHHPQAAQRAAFLQAFTAWYQYKPLKILISIRSDYMYALHELEQAIIYTPNFQEKFALKKFTPPQATEIFKVLAELNQLPFDEDFVSDMCRSELAKEAGLISPVDIQILAWLIAGFQQEEYKGFNKKLFLQKGGVEGLLENFLAFSIESLSGKSKRELAVKVLLTLIDKEKNLRAGALTFAQIQEKLSGVAADIKPMLAWLEDSKVRLITAIDEEGSAKKYELAHEKLIKGVFNLAKGYLEGYEQANLLLERRVAEWLGNSKSWRYLLSVADYRFIKKNQPFLIWGEREVEKKALLFATKRQWQWQGGAVLLVLAVSSGWQAWLYFTPQGQIYECKMDFQEVNDTRFLTDKGRKNAVFVFLKNEKNEKNRFKLADISQLNLILPIAEKITNESYKDDIAKALAEATKPLDKSLSMKLLTKLQTSTNSDKADILKALAEAASSLDKSKAMAFLQQLQITDESDKADIFKTMAEAAAPLDKSKAMAFLQQLQIVSEKITDESDKADILKALAEAASSLDKSKAIAFVQQLQIISEKITSHRDKAEVFKVLVQVAALLDKSKAIAFVQQLQIVSEKITSNRDKAEVFKVLVQVAALLDKSQAVEFLMHVKIASEKIIDESDKADVFKALAEVALPLDKSLSMEFLMQGKSAAKKITSNQDKADVFKGLVQAAILLDKSQAVEFLTQLQTEAEKITSNRDKANVFQAMAEAATPLDKSLALVFLKQGKSAAEKIIDNYSKAGFFQALARTAAPLDKTLVMEFLTQLQTLAKKITSDSDKAEIFQALAEAAAFLDKSQTMEFLTQLQTEAEKITSHLDKANVFKALVQAAALLDKSQAVEFLMHGKIAAEKIIDESDKAEIFQTLAKAAAFLDKAQSIEFLQQLQTVAEEMTYSYNKAYVFKALAEAAAPLDKSLSMVFLTQLQTAIEKFDDDFKADVFKSLAEAAVPLDKSQTVEFLTQLQTEAEKITSNRDKANVFKSLADAAAPLDKAQAVEFLKQGKTLAEKNTSDSDKTEVFKALIQSTALLDNSQAVEFLTQLQTGIEQITSDSYKAEVFKALIQAAASLDKSQAVEFLTQLQTGIEQITSDSYKAEVFKVLAEVVVPLNKILALDMISKAVVATKNTDIVTQIEIFKDAANLNAQEGRYREACQLANQNVDPDGALQILAIVLREYGKKEFAAKKQPVTEL